MTLFDKERHEILAAPDWNAEQVRDKIEGLLQGLLQSRLTNGYWPTDDMVRGSIYEGAAGVYWALDALDKRGFGRGVPALPALWDASFAGDINAALFALSQVPLSHSFLLGETGALLVQYKLTGDLDLDRLHGLINENRNHPWMEFLWGAPSTMLTAVHAHTLTADDRFAEEVRLGADYLWRHLEVDEEAGCRLWNIELYGEKSKLTGAGHGFVGNVSALIRMPQVFNADEWNAWRGTIIDFVLKTVRREEGLANWPPSIGTPREGRDKILVQWCHGAPGFVINLAPLFGTGSSEFDRLLLEAGELIWQAGPLTKYPSLCHGTPGSGYAFLVLYRLTGDAMWLHRAQVFAMAALQTHRVRQPYDDPDRFGLWTGDAGLAIYLADCLEEMTTFPTLDYF